MNRITTYRRTAMMISVIVLSVFLLVKCLNKTRPEAAAAGTRNNDGKAFAGSATCASCHKDVYDKHLHSAHYLASRPAYEKYIKGSFGKGKNTVAFAGSARVDMEKRDSGFFQVEYAGGVEKNRQPFDIVVGAGKNGQTYLYWNKDRLLQLPVFYFTANNQWANSPGYPDRIIFNRVITSRCLECHSTYAQRTSAANIRPEKFDRSQIIYGVDCERCHGPAAAHVDFHQKNPGEHTGKYIIDPTKFNRQQKLDMCAVCHGGSLNSTKPTFSFEAGDTLTNYFTYNTIATDIEGIDVHGNQYGLLASSQCYIKSEMTCNSCHSSHENETGQLTLFSQRCMTCHNNEHGNFCKIKNVPAPVLAQNCIDCHMPKQPSKAIVFLEGGTDNRTAISMRSHLIKIYPDVTGKILAFMKEKGNTATKETQEKKK